MEKWAIISVLQQEGRIQRDGRSKGEHYLALQQKHMALTGEFARV